MLDSIYHMTLSLIKTRIFWRGKILSSFTQKYSEHHYIIFNVTKSVKHWGVILFLCVISLQGATSCDKYYKNLS